MALDKDYLKIARLKNEIILDKKQNIIGTRSPGGKEKFFAVAEYNDDGTLKAIKDLNDTEASVGGGVVIDQTTSNLKEFLSPTESYKHPMPSRSRITQFGSELFNPIGVTPRMVLNCTVEDHIGYPHLITTINNDSTPQVPCRRIVPTDVNCKVRYDNLNIMMPADGLLQLPVYFPNVPITTTMYMIVTLFQRGAGTNKVLVNATGYYDADVSTRRYTYTRFGLESGFNVLQLFNPNNINHLSTGRAIGMLFNEATGSSGAWNDANPIIGIEIEWKGMPATDIDGNAVVGMKLPFGSLLTQTKMKPVIMMIPDTSNANIYDKLVPIFKAKGLPLTLRWGGTNGSRRQLLTKFLANQDIDHYDGSFSRLAVVGEDTDFATFLPEAVLGQGFVSRYGHHRGAILYSGAGNSIPSKAVAQRVFKETGHKFSKAGTRQAMITPLTPFGIANPYGMPALGYRGFNKALEDINVVKTFGGILIWFVHECVDFANRLPGDASHVLYVDRPNNSGGGIYTEDAQALAEYLAAGVANGEYDVMSISQLATALNT